MNSTSVRRLQEQLRLISHYGNNLPMVAVDGIYGEETENAVRSFQQLFGLDPTGKLDIDTLEAINEVYVLILEQTSPSQSISLFPSYGAVVKEGDESDLVLVIQLMLNSIAERFDNFDCIETNGKFGTDTTANVKELQRANLMEQNGSVDQSTWNALARLYDNGTGQEC